MLLQPWRQNQKMLLTSEASVVEASKVVPAHQSGCDVFDHMYHITASFDKWDPCTDHNHALDKRTTTTGTISDQGPQ